MKKVDLNKKITEHYEEFQKKLLEQLIYALGQEKSKLYVEYCQEFQKILEVLQEEITRRLENLRQENELLRKLLGVGEEEVKAQLLEQHQELLFLREELLKLKSLIEEKDRQIFDWKQKLAFSEEEKQVLIADYQKQRKNYEEQLQKISQQFSEFKETVDRERHQISQEKQNLFQEKENYRQKNYREIWEYARQLLVALASQVRNTSGIIAGSAQWMQERIQKLRQQKHNPLVGKKIQKLLNEISPDLETIVKSVPGLIKNLESFQELLGDKLPVTGPVNLENVFRNVSNQLSNLIMNKRAEIIWPKSDRKQKLPVPRGTEEKVAITLKEIIKNALESMVQGIKIEITVQETPTEVAISVANNGPRIKPADEDKIFQPFFTTKPGQNGLGLVRAKKNIMDLNGSIYFDSQKSLTTFTIVLPKFLG